MSKLTIKRMNKCAKSWKCCPSTNSKRPPHSACGLRGANVYLMLGDKRDARCFLAVSISPSPRNISSLANTQDAHCHDPNAGRRSSRKENKAECPFLPWEHLPRKRKGSRNEVASVLVAWLVSSCVPSPSIPLTRATRKQPSILYHHLNPITSPCWHSLPNIHLMVQNNCLSLQSLRLSGQSSG